MKRFRLFGILVAFCMIAAGCATSEKVTNDSDGTYELTVDKKEDAESEAEESNTETSEAETSETEISDTITDEAALAAVEKYCYDSNPDLKEMVEAGEYNVGWNIDSSNDDEVVVLYTSYTSAEVRYYIDRSSGETRVTEYVEGITPEESETGETFNINDYIE